MRMNQHGVFFCDIQLSQLCDTGLSQNWGLTSNIYIYMYIMYIYIMCILYIYIYIWSSKTREADDRP